MSRAREMRAQRRAAQFAKFRITELNLVPLVDTFVSIVFFALTTATVGELSPVIPGIRLPEAQAESAAHQQLTLGIGPQVTLGGRTVMSTVDAARARSNDGQVQAAQAQSDNPAQPLLIPPLYDALHRAADSIRTQKRADSKAALEVPLAIQGDRSMRYDLLARVMQTARLAGFKNLSLQVSRTETSVAPAAGATQ